MRLAPARVAARGGSRRFEQRAWQGADHGPAFGDARKRVQDHIGYDFTIANMGAQVMQDV